MARALQLALSATLGLIAPAAAAAAPLSDCQGPSITAPAGGVTPASLDVTRAFFNSGSTTVHPTANIGVTDLTLMPPAGSTGLAWTMTVDTSRYQVTMIAYSTGGGPVEFGDQSSGEPGAFFPSNGGSIYPGAGGVVSFDAWDSMQDGGAAPGDTLSNVTVRTYELHSNPALGFTSPLANATLIDQVPGSGVGRPYTIGAACPSISIPGGQLASARGVRRAGRIAIRIDASSMVEDIRIVLWRGGARVASASIGQLAGFHRISLPLSTHTRLTGRDLIDVVATGPDGQTLHASGPLRVIG
jgi:hypothetical protein